MSRWGRVWFAIDWREGRRTPPSMDLARSRMCKKEFSLGRNLECSRSTVLFTFFKLLLLFFLVPYSAIQCTTPLILCYLTHCTISPYLPRLSWTLRSSSSGQPAPPTRPPSSQLTPVGASERPGPRTVRLMSSLVAISSQSEQFKETAS